MKSKTATGSRGGEKDGVREARTKEAGLGMGKTEAAVLSREVKTENTRKE